MVAQGKTRAQVRAELAEAQRNGDLIADGETGATHRQLYPHRYAAQDSAQAKTREQVKQELVEARRSGQLQTTVN